MRGALLSSWRKLAGDGAGAIGERLLDAWSGPQRRYHSLGHLQWLLEEAERRRDLIHDARFVGYAIWFHDAVYEPGKPDNEERSAIWAQQSLASETELVGRVARVILMTKNHAEGDAVGDAALFLDMDIAILGAERPSYAAYAAGVRAEYAFAPDAAFVAGRSAFLKSQLALQFLFRTDVYRAELEQRARENIAWELDELAAGRIVTADAR